MKLSVLIPLLWVTASLSALPQKREVRAGEVEFSQTDAKTLTIRASDKAIIQYPEFHIGEGESVHFEQPSAHAIVLNRVKGGEQRSEILGHLGGNGRIFLVNPHGVYFGPKATVNVGSFLASTLNIKDEDFLKGEFNFFTESGSESASIENYGQISAHPEGFIALMAPVIQQYGSITAQLGKVVLASTKKATLDFSGDGLIQFTVEGELEEALIANYGSIEAVQGRVALSMNTASQAIKMVVNSDGILPAHDVEECGGVIRLVSNSRIVGERVSVEGGDGGLVDVCGRIDASHKGAESLSEEKAQGGGVHILGQCVQLRGAEIDVSGDHGGGTVLIGGDYQGKGEVPNAEYCLMDAHSQIFANATLQGDGGKVILWSDDSTLFNGQIFAKGGALGGNGGFVETSGKENLGVPDEAYVDTSAPFGKFGQWLLDPNTINITTGGGASIAQCSSPNCPNNSNLSISPATIAASATNVALCSQQTATSSITVTNAITMSNSGVSLTLTAGSGSSGNINLNNTIRTRGAALTLNGVVVVGANVTLDTTNSGASPAGANITLSTTVNGSGARTLALNAGTGGTVTMGGTVGATTALTTLTATGATINQNSTARTTGALSYTGSTAINVSGNITTTASGSITMNGPVVISGTRTFDTTNTGASAGANISFSDTLDGAAALTLRAGTGTVTFTGAVGGANALTNLAFTSAALIQVGNDITVTGANALTFPSAVSLTGASDITSNNANVSFNSTLNGAQALTVIGGTGTATFTGAVGGTTPLTSLTATAATITQTSTAKTTGALSYTGSSVVNVRGNITTSSGIVTLTGPVAITTAPTIDTTNAGGSAGADISFSSTLNGATALTLRAGSGTVTFGGAVGATSALTNLAFTSAALIQIGSNITVTGANALTFPSSVSLTGDSVITSNNANVSFGSTLNGAQNLTVNGGIGTTTFTGAVGGATPLTSLTATAATITQSAAVQTTGALSYTGSTAINVNDNITTDSGSIALTGPVNLANTPTFDSTNAGGSSGAQISFSSTLNGGTDLTLRAGSGTVTFGGAVGGASALTNLSFTSAGLIQVGNNITVTGASALTFPSPVSLTGGSTITTSTNNGNITFSSTLNGAQALALAAGTGTVTFTGAVGGTNALTNLTFSSAGLIQVGNNITVTGASALTFPSPVSLTGGSIITTSANNGNITFSSTLNGAQALTLTAGTGSCSFVGAVGGTSALSSLTIASANNVTANAITASTITQSAGTGTSTLNGVINTTGSSGISLTGTNFALNANITTTNNGNLTISHSGSLTIASGVTLNIDGAFTESGATGTTSLSGNIVSNGHNISFATPVTLGATVSLDSGISTGNILFGSTVNGAQNLTLSSGGGNIVFTGAVGGTTRLGTLTVTTANNFTANALTLAAFSQAAGAGVTTFNGAVDLNTVAGLSFTGTNATINNTMTTTNAGPVLISVSGTLILTSSGVLNLSGAFTQSGSGGVQTAGSITTANQNIQFGSPVALTSATTLSSGAGVGNILFSTTLDGPGNLSLTAGTGNITFSTAVGGLTRLGSLTINSAANISALAVKAASINQVAASGTSTYNGDIDTNTVSGVQLAGSIFSITGNLITTAAGPFTITNSGLLTLVSGGSTSVTGAFTQNGTGAVNLSGTILTSNTAISFARAITLSAATTLNSGTGAGSITLSSTVDGTVSGAQTLTLMSGTGNTTLSGNIGSSVRLSDVTINQAATVSTQGITAKSLTQLVGSVATTFNGAIDTSTVSGISLTGTAFTFKNSVTTTAAGPLVVTNNSGILTFDPGTICTIGGAFSQLGTGSVSLGGQITAGGTIGITGQIAVAAAATLTTAAASQNITLSSTVNGGNNLTLAAGGGNITIGDVVGGTTRLGTLTFSSANDISTQSITAANIVQSAGSGTTTISGSTLNTNGATGINLTLTNFSRNGSIVTTGGGSVVIVNSGTVTLVSPGTTSISGSFQQNGGAGTVSFSGTLTTANQAITFSSPMTLTGSSTLTSGAGAGNISLSTVTGAQTLTLLAGTGSITTGAIGAIPLTSVTFTSANNITAGAISAGSITQTASSGTATFNGALTTTTASGISLTGTNFLFSNSVTTTTGFGPFSLNHSGSATFGPGITFSIGGAFSQTGTGTVSLGANISTSSGTISFAAPITLNGATTLNSSAGNNNITLSSTLNGAQTLSMAAGSGNIAISGAIGATTALSSFTVTGAGNITLPNIGTVSAAGVSGSTTLTATTNLNFNGTNYNLGAQTLTATTANFNAGALTTIATNGNAFSISATTMQLSSGTNLTINSANGAITMATIRAVAGNLRTLTLNAGTGPIQVAQIGASNNSEFAAVSLTGGNLLIRGDLFANALTLSSTGGSQISLGGNITTVNTAVNFPVAVVRDTITTATVSTGSTGGNITFASTINGDVALTRNLTLAAGSGNITLSGAVGGTTSLRALTISSANNVTLNALTLGLLVQSAGIGTTTFNGAINTSNILGINLTGSAFTFNNTVTTTNAGALQISNSGLLSMPSGATCTLSGTFSQTGSGAVQLGNSIASNDGILITSAISLTDAMTLNTSAQNKTIQCLSSIDSLSTTPYDLTLDAGTGNISIAGGIGTNHAVGDFLINHGQNIDLHAITANSAILNGGTGTTTVEGDILVGSGGINASGNNFVANGNVTTTNGGGITLNNSGTSTGDPGFTTICDGDYNQIGSGPFFAGGSTVIHGNLLITSPLTIFAPSVFDLSAGGNMTFLSAIDGGSSLSLLSNGGTISFSGNIGSSVPIGALSISGAGNVTTQGIQAASISQTVGVGTTTFNGPLVTTGASGIAIATTNVVRGAAITTSGVGGLTITNSGTFTSTAAGAISLAGAFVQNGSGSVSLGGSITTSNANISFSSPITLAAAVSLLTGTGVTGNITLSQSVQGAFGLTLNSGGGNTTLSGNVGTSTALTSLTITRAANVSTQAITAGFISQAAGSGTSSFNGALSTSGASGISLTGTSFTFNGTITTAASGPLSVTNSGTLTFGSGATGTISGALTQSGAGSTQLSSSLTSGGAMQFNGAFTVSGSGSLNTSAANQSITFFNTLNGPGNLTLSSGTGDILLSGNAGSTTALGSLTVSTVRHLTAQAITASSFTQSAGTGTSLINGNIATSGSGGIHLTGSAFTFLQNITTTGSGPITITNSGTLTTTAGKTITANGIFTQDGSGSVLLGSAITTTNVTAANAHINFTGTSAITLIAPSTIDSTTGGGTITFAAASTVNGAQAFTIAAGTGDINILGDFGGVTRLGAFTMTSAADITVQAITASSITQSAGSGTSTLLGSLDTDGPAGMTFIGNNFTVGPAASNITTTNGGSFTVTNQGLVTGSGPTVTTVDGSFIQNGPGPIVLGGPLTANQGMSFTGPAIIALDATFDSSAGSGNIVFSSTIDGNVGNEAFTLTAGGGSITFGDAVGSGTQVGILTIQSANNVTASSLIVDSIATGSSLSGLATFNGTIATSGAGGIVLDGNALTFSDDVTTTSSGVVTITNSGALNIGSGVLFDLDGAFTQSGSGPISLGGTITTTDDAISFASAVTLSAPAAVDSGAGLGDITFSGTVDGGNTLSVTAGTGDVTFTGTVGHTTPLTTLTVNSATDVLFDGDTTLTGAFEITSASGTTTFSQSLEASAITLNGATINLNGAADSTSGAISIVNSNTLTIASMSAITSSTSFSQTGAGSVSLGSNITTAGALSIASAVTMTDHVTLDSGGGNLTLSSTVEGSFNLTLTAGSGDMTLLGAIGNPLGNPRIGAFTLTSVHDISVQAITASSINQQSGTGTATLHGNLDTDGLAGITLVGTNFVSSGTVTTTNGGPFILTNSGLATGTGASTITVDGAFTQNGTGPINTGGTITTSGGHISHTSAVNVLLPATFTSNGGNITFSNTVNGPDCLTLVASAGTVTFDAAVGGTTPLGCLTASGSTILQKSLISNGPVQETGTTAIRLLGNITTSNDDITLTGNTLISAASITLSSGAGIGNISVSGTVNGDVAGRNLTLQAGTGNITLSSSIGASTSLNNLTFSADTISWGNLGSASIGATGTTTLTAATDINFTGIIYNGSSQSYTAGSNFNITGSSAVSVTSPAAAITFSSGTIQLSQNLTVDSNNGTITMGSLLGTGFDFTVDAGTGAYNFVQIGDVGAELNDVDLTADAFDPTPTLNTNVFANNLVVNSLSPQTISTDQLTGTVTYNSPILFDGDITYACGSAGTITFNYTVDAVNSGVDTLTFDFNPCTGSIIFNEGVGTLSPFASITILSPDDVTLNAVMNIGSFAISGGTGTTSVNSGLVSTAAQGISISSPVINLAGAISTANEGTLVLDNSGTLTIAAGTSFDISGDLQQTGSGDVIIGGSVITHDSAISFTGPITLTGDMTFDSNDLTGGNISFADTIEGAQNVVVIAGGFDVSFGGAVGTALTPLKNLIITSARHVTASAPIYAQTVTQAAGTGTASFDAITTSGANGIQLTGSAITMNGNITTTGGGPFIVTNAGPLTLGSATYSIAGALTQNGAGVVSMAGTFTAGGAATFARAVTLTGTTSVNTSANSQNILFSSTVTNDNGSAHNLTLSSGSGNITFTGSVGATAIGGLTISTAGNVTAGAITATSILQSAGTGTTSINGNMTTSGGSGISLTGATMSLNSTVTTTNAGPFTISNTGPLTLTLGSSTSIAGAFTQSGGGSVSLSGTLATSNQNISFANPITLGGNTTLSSGAGAGNITLSSAVNGNRSLSLTAGTGDVTFGGNLGQTTGIGAITISSVRNITYPLTNAASIVQTASSGTTTITGPFNTTGALGVSISGGVINQNGAITTNGSGPVTFTNTGTLTIGSGVTTAAAGGYTQSGGGSVSLGGSISTTSNPISFANAVTLTANIVLNAGPTSSNSANISFGSTITGARSLTLTAPGGSILLSGNVGVVGTPLTGFTITDATSVTTQGIISNFITQSAGNGTVTFNGALSTAAIAGISLIGTNFTFNSTLTTAAAGPLNINHTGLLTFSAGATGSIAGAFNQTGTGTTQLSSTITAGGAMQFNGPFRVSGTGALNTSAANQSISFFTTLNGPGDLTLSTGTGDILVSGTTGGTTPLGNLTVSTVRNLTLQAITAAAITQSAGTGTTLVNGNIVTSGGSGVQFTGTALTVLQNITTTGGGPITLTNSGTLTLTAGKTISSNGVFTQNGSGNVSLGSSIMTTNATAANAHINFTGTSPITLTAASAVDSSIGGGTITFSADSTVNGGQAFTLSAGTGNIDVLGNFGGITRLGALTITGVHDLQLQTISANSIKQLAGTGTTSLLGSIDTDAPEGMTFIGNNFTTGLMASAITTTNGGSLILTNAGVASGEAPVTITVDGSYIQNGTGIIFVGGVTARQGISFSGPGILAASGTMNTSDGGGDITFNNVVCALAGTEDLILNAGIGNITFTETIGGETSIGFIPVTALGSLNATGETISLANVGTLSSPGINGALTLNASGNVDFNGTVYNTGEQNYTVAPSFAFDFNSGALTTLLSNGANISFMDGVGLMLGTGTNLTIDTGNGDLSLETIHAEAGNLRTLVLDAGTGSIQVGDIGTEGEGEFASVSFTATDLTLGHEIADELTFDYTGTLHATGDIISTDTALSFPGTVILDATNTFSTLATTGAAITFAGTVDGLVDDAFGLTLNAGIGAVNFDQDVGATHRLSNLTIYSAGDVILDGAATMIVDSLFQFAGFGTTVFNGALVVPTNIGISLTGSSFAFNNFVQTLNNGSLSVSNSGTLTFNGVASLSGAFTQTGSGTVNLSGSITAGQPILFTGATTLVGDPLLDTSAADQSITFLSTLNGGGNLTLAAGGGDISLQGNAGLISRLGTLTVNSSHNITIQSLSAASIDLQSSTGTATVNGALNSDGAAGMTFIGKNFILNGSLVTTGGGSVVVTNSGLVTGFSISSRTIDGSYTQNGTGPVNYAGSLTANGTISFSSPITLLATSIFNSSSGNGDITFSSTIEGPGSLSVSSGSGDILFSDDIGVSTTLGNITIPTAHDLTMQVVKASSITQQAGSGTTILNADVTTSGLLGINLTGTNITRGASWTTANSGPIIVNNSGLFTSTAAGTIVSSGSFTQSGAGAVSISRTLTTNDADINFSGPVTLAVNMTFNSGSGSGAISFTNTVDAAASATQTLTLTSGMGNISFGSGVGTTTRLGAVTVTSANNVSFNGLRTSTFSQETGSGTTTLSGATNTSTIAGIDITTSAITLNGSITTTSSGPITLANAGLLTITGACSVSGAFTQSGAGTSSLSGSITSGGAIFFTTGMTVSGSPSLTTSNQLITLSSTINGSGNLSLNSGSANMILGGTIGGSARLGALTFTSADDITAGSITASSITQVAASGTTTITGNLNTNGINGIQLTGTAFNLNGSVVTTGGGPVVIDHTSDSIFTFGSSTLLSGPFSETGNGGISLAGTLHANNANITFTNPITLIDTTTLDSDGGGDILISDTIDGDVDLTFVAGSGNITLAGAIGSVTPVNSLIIESAANVTAVDIAADYIVQSAGSVLTTFNGTLTTTAINGIQLTGTAFTFNAPVETQGNGPVVVTNSGLLTISAGAPFTLMGSFSQLGIGAVSLSDSFDVPGNSILFTGAVTLGADVLLDTDSGLGNVTFIRGISGLFDLHMNCDFGEITFTQNIGPIDDLQVDSASVISAQSITASSIALSGIANQATINGNLTTNGAGGILLSGAAFNVLGDVVTTSAGPFTITNSDEVHFSSNFDFSLDGPFLQNGTGRVFGGGHLMTNDQTIEFQAPFNLTGNLSLESGSVGNDITFGMMNKAFSLTIAAHGGDVVATEVIGGEVALTNCTVTSAHDIYLSGIGTTATGVTGTLNLTASNDMHFINTLYSAHTQVYFAGNEYDFHNGMQTHLTSFGGDITFTTGVIHLDTSNDLHIVTNNGNFSFASLLGTSFENINIETGTGTAVLGSIASLGTINNLFVDAGEITLTAPIDPVNTHFTSLNSILNSAGPVLIQCTNTPIFNALEGNVGSLSSPILVHSDNQIFAGANQNVESLADFNGSSFDNTVHALPTNPPCKIIFNGVVIKDCTIPPSPPAPPSPAQVRSSLPFAVPGFDSSWFNLASDYFFMLYFFDELYLRAQIPLYYHPSPVNPPKTHEPGNPRPEPETIPYRKPRID